MPAQNDCQITLRFNTGRRERSIRHIYAMFKNTIEQRYENFQKKIQPREAKA